MHFYRSHTHVAGFQVSRDDNERDFPLIEAGEVWARFDWTVNWHENPGWELYFQEKGTSDWETEARPHGQLHVPEGGCYLMPPDKRHCLKKHRGSDPHFYFVVFPELELADGLRKELKELTRALALARTHGLKHPFQGLIKALLRGGNHQQEIVRSYMDCLVATLMQRISESGSAFATPKFGHPAVLHARDVLHQNLAHAWKLDELAGLCGVSKAHLIDLFQQELAEPPHRYLLRLRLEESARLLRESHLSVTNIALDVGFCSGQHLAQAFRLQFNCTPTQWRRQGPASDDPDSTSAPRTVPTRQ